jgi:hypothetical protein
MGVLILLFVLVIPGCHLDEILVPEQQDIPGRGIMVKKTAEKIFYYESKKGVILNQFKSTEDLRKYLKGSSGSLAESKPIFLIKEIDEKPVTGIAREAFSPLRSIPNIFTVVSVIKLPETIEELGDGLFDGLRDREIYLDIPVPVVKRLVEEYIEKVQAEEGPEAARAAQETPDETKAAALERVVKGSSIVVREFEPSVLGKPETPPKPIVIGPALPETPPPAGGDNPPAPSVPPLNPPASVSVSPLPPIQLHLRSRGM